MAKLKLSNAGGVWQLALDGKDITDQVLELGFKVKGGGEPEVVLHLAPGAEVEFDDMSVSVAVALEGEQDD